MVNDTETQTGARGPGRKMVLVVDDDPLQLVEITDYLRHKGLDVLECADGALAVREIDRHKPALVLMDVKRPGCDGIRAAQIGQMLSPSTMFLLISGYPKEVVRAEKADCAVPVLHKPIPLRQLSHFVAGVLGESTGG